MTKARRAALAALAAAAEPQTAAELSAALGGGCDPATVYRALHWLEAGGWADSFVLHCAGHGTERYWSARRSATGAELPHRHWFHCEACHRFVDLGGCRLDALVADYEAVHGFAVAGHSLYLSGRCSGCRAAGL